jgi:hypothetical protein
MVYNSVSHPFQARSQNCEKRLLPSSCLSVCSSAWSNSAPTQRIFIKFGIWAFFRISVDKIQVSLKSDKNNGHFTWKPIHILKSYLPQFFLEWEMFQTQFYRQCFRQFYRKCFRHSSTGNVSDTVLQEMFQTVLQEMFQTQFYRKSTHILRSTTFSPIKSYCLCAYVYKCGTARDEDIWFTRIALWVPKATNTHSEYATLTAYP